MSTAKKASARKLDPIHPGDLPGDELAQIGAITNQLGRDQLVTVNRIGEIVKGKRAVTADTVLRLPRYFGTAAQLWMTLQSRYDLEVAEARKLQEIERDVRPMAANAARHEIR